MSKPYELRGYTESQRDQLLMLIAGGMTQTMACQVVDIPPVTVAAWVRKDDAFAERWRVAKIAQTHTLGDECMEIADAPAVTMAEVQRAKLRIETRKWLMSKWAPKHYGDHMRAEHTHHVGVVMLPPLKEQKAIKSLADYTPATESEGPDDE